MKTKIYNFFFEKQWSLITLIFWFFFWNYLIIEKDYISSCIVWLVILIVNHILDVPKQRSIKALVLYENIITKTIKSSKEKKQNDNKT